MDVNITFLSLTGKKLLKIVVPDDTSAEFQIREAVRCAILSGANLRGADLSRANLSGAVLSHADLSCANLSCAKLSNADLSRANLNGADLNGADLNGANLNGANLRGVNLRADLSGADLSGADLSDTDLRNADLSGAERDEFVVHPDFGHLVFSGAYFRWGYVDQKTGVPRIEAGCHCFTIAEARAYWVGKPDRRETLAAVDYFEAVMKLRGAIA